MTGQAASQHLGGWPHPGSPVPGAAWSSRRASAPDESSYSVAGGKRDFPSDACAVGLSRADAWRPGGRRECHGQVIRGQTSPSPELCKRVTGVPVHQRHPQGKGREAGLTVTATRPDDWPAGPGGADEKLRCVVET